MKASVGVNRLHEEYGDRAEFLLVYIREAHPKDGWAVEGWSGIEDPETFDERCRTAQMTVDQLGIGYDVVVDGMDDAVAVAYAGWPERLYVIGTDGKIRYAGGQGPWGFHPTPEQRHPMAGNAEALAKTPPEYRKFIDSGPCLQDWLRENLDN